MTFKRKAINFNLSCPHQKELYDFCMSQSTNFSGFVKSVLFHFMKDGQMPREVSRMKNEVSNPNDVSFAKTFL